jgi:hypothetical protein
VPPSAISEQEKMTALEDIRAHVLPVLGDAIVEWCRRTHQACEPERTELELIRPGRLPRAVFAVAVNSYAHTVAGFEGDGAASSGVSATSLKLNEPGCAA